MNKTDTSQHILIGTVILVIIMLAGCWFLIYSQMQHTGKSISVLLQTQSTAAVRTQEIKDITVSADTASSEADKVNAHIISPDGEVAFIDDVENLAKADGLTVQVDTVGLSQAADVSGAGLEYLNVKLSVSGTWASTYGYLSTLEASAYDLVVNQSDFSLVSDGMTKGPIQWQSTFQISVLKQQSPTEQH